jgi:L-fuconolactonase
MPSGVVAYCIAGATFQVKWIVDSQIHVWEANNVERPWSELPRAANLPEFTCEQALSLMDTANVHMAILIPPIWARFQNEYALACAGKYPDRFAVVGWFDPTTPNAPQNLKMWLDQRYMVGIRLIVTIPPGSNWLHAGHLEGGALDWFWGAAEESRIPLMIRITHAVSELAGIARQHPKLRLIVDHCAAESEITPLAFAAIPELLKLARWQNIYVRLSSLAKYSASPSPYSDMDHIVRSVVSAFGPDRCMWGSDITHYMKRLPYSEVVDQFRLGCTFLSASDRELILGQTAFKVFGLLRDQG